MSIGVSYYSNKSFGCKHYKLAVLIRAPCCKNFYPCRFDHDENENHEINRKDIHEMICMYCLHDNPSTLVQPVQKQCKDCHKDLANYYCDICHLFSQNSELSYHCDKCGICRIKANKTDDNFHCDICNCCYKTKNHICKENVFDNNCPVCQTYLFTSRDDIIQLNCLHNLHSHCYTELFNNADSFIVGCPVCRKSIVRIPKIESQIENYTNSLIIPEEYKDIVATICCNDCLKLSKVPFKFMYHKCQECGSWNTYVKEKQTKLTDY